MVSNGSNDAAAIFRMLNRSAPPFSSPGSDLGQLELAGDSDGLKGTHRNASEGLGGASIWAKPRH